MRSANREKTARTQWHCARASREDEGPVVTSQEFVGRPLDECFQMLARIGEPAPADATTAMGLGTFQQRQSVPALRQFLSDEEGDGYWDLYLLAPHLSLTITHAIYHRDTWVNVEGQRFFKLRYMLSGELLGAGRTVFLAGPQAHLFVCADGTRTGYFIRGGVETKLVILHCRPKVLRQMWDGGDGLSLPEPLRHLVSGGSERALMRRIGFGLELMQATQRMIESRHTIPGILRHEFVRCVAMEMLCQTFANWLNFHTATNSLGLSQRDVASLHEARDYLSQHFTRPPTIERLGRVIGMNRTKLKAGFRSLFGVTIRSFITGRRMQLAAELLATGQYHIGDVGYRVGYTYPSNFTSAFKRHYGRLPFVVKATVAEVGSSEA